MSVNLLTLEDEKFKTVTLRDKLVFKIRYISPKDRAAIIRTRVALSGGMSVEAYTADEYRYLKNIAICDVCTEDGPPDFFKPNISCQNWDDEDLINELAFEIEKHTEEVVAKLKKNKSIE